MSVATHELRAEYRRAQSRVAGLTAHRPGSPELEAARARLTELWNIVNEGKRDEAAAKLEDHARRVAAKAPPLTPEQIDKIASILSGRS